MFKRVAENLKNIKSTNLNHIIDVEYMEPASEKVRFLNDFIQEMASIVNEAANESEYSGDNSFVISNLEAVEEVTQYLPKAIELTINSLKGGE